MDRKSGKICYMLAARSLTIHCGDGDSDDDSDDELLTDKEWIHMNDSRLVFFFFPCVNDTIISDYLKPNMASLT